MDKKYCEVKEIDGKETITNIVLATEEIAKERGYVEIPDAEIGAQKVEGKFCKPEIKPPEKPQSRMDKLLSALVDNKLITEEQARNIN